jgi:UDP-N-acetylmuramate: L-alanyl-gamma-D-glutamyl-meso-diaminopimelate ligase
MHLHKLVLFVTLMGGVADIARDANLARVIERGCWTPIERFDTQDGWQASAQDASGGFDVLLRGERVGRVVWELLGRHNQLNALAAIAAARYAGVAPAQACASLATFKSVKRRLELIGEAGGVTVYDDFAHHPTAIETTIAGLRRKVGAARILAVVEPRSNTMKLGIWKDALPASLSGAQRVFCFAANLGWDVDATMAVLGDKACVHTDVESLADAIAAEARAGDHVLVMSNGGFDGLQGKLLARLRAR